MEPDSDRFSATPSVEANPAPPFGGQGAVAFGERLLGLLEEGRFTATYKYAVLLGLMDLCLEHTTAVGAAPEMVTTEQLAEKILELYWPHTTAFDGEAVLRQSALGSQTKIVTAILRFRHTHAPDPSATLATARISALSAFRRLLRTIEWRLVENPLPRLQRVGQADTPFVYRIGWDDRILRSEFLSPEFDNRIMFVPDAAEHLVRLSGLLRPLIQREWASMVSRMNPTLVEDARLEEFLFGAHRIPTDPVRQALRELQANTCFYCGRRIAGPADVDHFLPWSRYPDNGIENLVVADPRCNGAKRHFLAAADHVERWADRIGSSAEDLATIASEAAWDRHPERTLNVARAIYLRLPDDIKLWLRAKEFVDLDRTAVERALVSSGA